MQIIHSISNSPTFNLAAEEYLFSERDDDLLFLYVNEPSVIIGCNQAIQNEVDLEFCEQNQIQVVRRMSGGGAVFHDLGNLNFCFISIKAEGKSSLNDDFLKPIVEVLTGLGIQVQIGKRKDLWLPGGFKVSGTASHVTKNRELHHGTLLYDSNLKRLLKSLSPNMKNENLKGIPSVPSPVKNIRKFMTEKGIVSNDSVEMFDKIKQNLLELFCLDKCSEINNIEIEKIEFLRKNKYELKEWTFKR
jgi:lipoate-protein ligase A